MVRFIILQNDLRFTSLVRFTFQYGQIYYSLREETKNFRLQIYIPIWLDLLSCIIFIFIPFQKDLHSNMVRFIIFSERIASPRSSKFTFQYGQIYYYRDGYVSIEQQYIYIPIWLDLLYLFLKRFYEAILHLHSNMVRFIILSHACSFSAEFQFTFQYGQIYYSVKKLTENRIMFIYIPIWLDLLYGLSSRFIKIKYNLHSNMVRFIISKSRIRYNNARYIYIPIWLDLLLCNFRFGLSS